ncbi:MAG: hypothetical protein PWR31_351, partial [Bacillota bacterium]|nr:hypothetical protein [Bacillota bacterium]
MAVYSDWEEKKIESEVADEVGHHLNNLQAARQAQQQA